ncbi:MAG: ABC transporter permease [Acidimicrobiaceae bacterium]|nr:ABC transporter permease [Acidimicrobiaceae bacterium]
MRTPPALRATTYFYVAYRRTWRGTMMTTFVNPVLYLAAMGVGLGTFVNKGGHLAALGHLRYLDFVAPALAATTATTTAATEATFPVMGAIKWTRTYFGMLSTPLRVGDVLTGHLVWIAARVATAVAAYLVIMAAFGTIASPWAVMVLPAGVLMGMAAAAPLAAFAATQENDGAFSLVFRLGLVPLFLFSGVFFPISQLPAGIRVLAYATPLWHGVALCRGLTLGQLTLAGALGHVGYLTALVLIGSVWASYTYRTRLAS